MIFICALRKFTYYPLQSSQLIIFFNAQFYQAYLDYYDPKKIKDRKKNLLIMLLSSLGIIAGSLLILSSMHVLILPSIAIDLLSPIAYGYLAIIFLITAIETFSKWRQDLATGKDTIHAFNQLLGRIGVTVGIALGICSLTVMEVPLFSIVGISFPIPVLIVVSSVLLGQIDGEISEIENLSELWEQRDSKWWRKMGGISFVIMGAALDLLKLIPSIAFLPISVPAIIILVGISMLVFNAVYTGIPESIEFLKEFYKKHTAQEIAITLINTAKVIGMLACVVLAIYLPSMQTPLIPPIFGVISFTWPVLIIVSLLFFARMASEYLKVQPSPPHSNSSEASNGSHHQQTTGNALTKVTMPSVSPKGSVSDALSNAALITQCGLRAEEVRSVEAETQQQDQPNTGNKKVVETKFTEKTATCVA
ncbi:MAG: hypothetical protein K0Q74_683 [Gammaproteobacteria bacterium]|nr:hypothetical protein [Gammaproteobacteria bacterium]